MPYFYLDPSLFPTLRAATLSWPRMSLRVSIRPWSSPWAMWQMSRTSALKASSVVWTKETKFSWASFTPSASQLLHSSNDRIEDPDIAPSFSLKLSSGEVVSIIQKITEERFWNTISKQQHINTANSNPRNLVNDKISHSLRSSSHNKFLKLNYVKKIHIHILFFVKRGWLLNKIKSYDLFYGKKVPPNFFSIQKYLS